MTLHDELNEIVTAADKAQAELNLMRIKKYQIMYKAQAEGMDLCDDPECAGCVSMKQEGFT